MATQRTSGSTKSSGSSTSRASSNGAKRTSNSTTKRKSTSSAKGTTKPRAGSSGSSAKRRTSSGSSAKRSTPSRASSSSSSRNTASATTGGGIVETAKSAASRAKGPAVAVGAAAAGVAGALMLKSRGRRKTVLGVPMPRPKDLPDIDAKAIVKTVGNATRQFAKTSKKVSKDLERAGDQAERLGKILS